MAGSRNELVQPPGQYLEKNESNREVKMLELWEHREKSVKVLRRAVLVSQNVNDFRVLLDFDNNFW